jgi:hypothetical protein
MKERKDFIKVKARKGLVARITSRYEYVFRPGAEPIEMPRSLFESWPEEMRAQLEVVEDPVQVRDRNPSAGSGASRLRRGEEK